MSGSVRSTVTKIIYATWSGGKAKGRRKRRSGCACCGEGQPLLVWLHAFECSLQRLAFPCRNNLSATPLQLGSFTFLKSTVVGSALVSRVRRVMVASCLKAWALESADLGWEPQLYHSSERTVSSCAQAFPPIKWGLMSFSSQRWEE